MKLAEFIHPDLNVARSINIERDYRNEDVIRDYHVTTKTLEIIKRFTEALLGEKVTSWSLTGPYGMGKSAFVNFLLALTRFRNEKETANALHKLEQSDIKLYQKFVQALNNRTDNEGFLQVAVTAAYEPVNNTLARGLLDALNQSTIPNRDVLVKDLLSLLKQKIVDSQKLMKAFSNTVENAHRPMIIIIDEFGKNLDYMAHHPEHGDIFIVQQLAESKMIYLWVCLHQAFDEYVSGLSTVQRQEWSKVQGRFEDISFVESDQQMLYLIKKALRHEDIAYERIKKWAYQVKKFIEETDLFNKDNFDVDTIRDLYPLHPITAVALIELCRRYAQNDRTLLSFLCSGDKYALPAYLKATRIDEAGDFPVVGLDYLYNYFFNITSTTFINRAESQRWLEIQSKIEEYEYASPYDQALLKSIGILNLLQGSLAIKASKEVASGIVSSSLGVTPQLIEEKIDQLQTNKVLLYREYANEYRLWEGSDFDVYGEIRKKKVKLAIRSLDDVLQRYLPLTPVIASRHAYETGTIRRFERRWLDVESLIKDITPAEGYDGLFLYCYGTFPKPQFIPVKCKDGRPLLIAYVPSKTNLTELALEVAAAQMVLDESPEIEHDSVAKKELKFRIKVAKEQFAFRLNTLFIPDNDDVLWYAEGEQKSITSTKALSIELSSLCDNFYSSCPFIGNEMISYEKLSSAVSRARRELVEAMAEHENENQLGLKGFGPEVAIYRSLLLDQGLHVEDDKTGLWKFTTEGKDKNLKKLWEKIDYYLTNSGQKGVSVADLMAKLKAPPFGMRSGPTPIYIVLYLLVNCDRIALFQEGTYKPFFGAVELSLLLNRSDLFVLKYIISSNVQRRVFQIYKNILNTAKIDSHSGLRNTTMVSVVGPLINFIAKLPEYSKKTGDISANAQRVRSAIENSTEPIQLLFEDLPKAVGVLPEKIEDDDGKQELQGKLQAALQELNLAYPKLQQKIREYVLELFKEKDLDELYYILQKRIAPLVKICDDKELKAILQAFVRKYKTSEEWLKAIASRLVKKPVDKWRDDDYLPFTAKLKDFTDRIRQLEAIALDKGQFRSNNGRVVSIMLPNGHLKRDVLNSMSLQNAEVQSKVDDILAMGMESSSAVLILLAEKMLKGEEDE